MEEQVILYSRIALYAISSLTLITVVIAVFDGVKHGTSLRFYVAFAIALLLPVIGPIAYFFIRKDFNKKGHSLE